VVASKYRGIDVAAAYQYTATMSTISDELRAEIKATGKTAYALAKASGMAINTVNHFINGGQLSLAKSELLAEAIGKKLRLAKKSR